MQKEIEYMWYDAFENAYTKTKNEYAPPERYTLTFKGSDNYTYQENWCVGEGEVIGIAYSAEKYDSGECVRVRKEIAEYHNVELKKLRYWVIPADRYDKYEIEFGLKKQ